MIGGQLHDLLAQLRGLSEPPLLHQELAQEQASLNVIRVRFKRLLARDDRFGVASCFSETSSLGEIGLRLGLGRRSTFPTAGGDEGD